MKILGVILIFCFSISTNAQNSTYQISFENAVHHEAQIQAIFTAIGTDTLSLRMSRSSPGRYALHEFAKNVYGVNAFDSKGKRLNIFRPNPHEWQIVGHDNTVKIEYILFGNRGDGTYTQIDETHAHLNMPATFMYAPALSNQEIKVRFKLRDDLNWKVATQLPKATDGSYSAPNLSYFMDSPTELSNFQLRSFEVASEKGTKQTIKLALHHNGSETETDAYFEQVKKVVLEEKSIFGELPRFDFGSYTFLACYTPNASGDGMEHRNSTIVTSTRALANGGMERNIGTVSHEFFHAWNVERIRPKSLKPFNFKKTNMSGALWFAEGFTSYYTNLVLCRAGLMSPEKYVKSLTGTFNYVWNSPARQFFNPIEMSYQAPFVDAAKSVDPVNRENTFISYYSYGSVLGLALDLSLREKSLNLDDYMKLVWQNYGKSETAYTINNLEKTLATYAGKDFSNGFFNSFIYKSEMPNYKHLFSTVGVALHQSANPYIGIEITPTEKKNGRISNTIKMNTPAYKAALEKGDVITSINGQAFEDISNFKAFIAKQKVGATLEIAYNRFGVSKTTNVTLTENSNYEIKLMENTDASLTTKTLDNRKEWLKIM